MAKNTRGTTAGATLAVVLLMVGVQDSLWAASTAAEQPPISASEPTAIVRVDNVAAIPADLLQLAESRAGEVFHKGGARVTWVDTTGARQPMVPMFTLVLVNVERSRGPYREAQDAFGFAAPAAHRAWVFWDRIDAAKARVPAIGILLGDVMAHELGHLMLSSSGHSLGGIMRAEVAMHMRATETFTKRQAQDILRRLQQIRRDDSAK
jgi:hypothetical protein